MIFLAAQQKRFMAKKKTVDTEGIIWKQPQKYETYHPVVTGDLKPFQLPDPLEPKLEYQLIKEEIEK